jgi:hypothetical protein
VEIKVGDGESQQEILRGEVEITRFAFNLNVAVIGLGKIGRLEALHIGDGFFDTPVLPARLIWPLRLWQHRWQFVLAAAVETYLAPVELLTARFQPAASAARTAHLFSVTPTGSANHGQTVMGNGHKSIKTYNLQM